ncbi:MAG TPA: tetratricopeptide repeat protein [Gemmatimonadales bacterium]|nr:tetratricopeptide repeat protein [Gemmatimonadales bacterium]
MTRSLAILPFSNLSRDPQHEFFTDGLAEDLTEALALAPGLRIAQWSSTRWFKGQHATPAEAGGKLGVSHVLEAGVRRGAGDVQVSARLFDVIENAQIWTGRYARPSSEMLLLRGELIRGTIEGLGVEVPPAERRRVERIPTASARAYELYLEAHEFAAHLLRRSQESALDLFQQAVTADQRFAEAHAGVAVCHAMIFQYWDSSAAQVAAAEDASARALAIAPELAEARFARGLALSLGKDYDAAEQEFAAAIAAKPAYYDAHYFLARTCRTRGRLEDAARWFEAASRLRPEDYQSRQLLASVYVGLGRPDDAKAIQVESLELARRHLERYPDDARALYLGAGALASIGDSTRAREWAKRALAMDPDDSAVLYNVACAYAMLGLHDSAIDCLEQALANGFGHWEWIEHDSDLDSLRKHPRFEALAAKR